MSSPRLKSLEESITRLGFYPELTTDAVIDGLIGQDPQSHLVHLETHFEHGTIHRHITVLALTQHYLLVVHLDDHEHHQPDETATHLSVESFSIEHLKSVSANYVYLNSSEYQSGTIPSEVSIDIAWTGAQRLDLQPADCPDPQCQTNHGYTGLAVCEDISLRISSTADGEESVRQACNFVQALRKAQREAGR
ncbi:DUF5998 family protein [Rothia sp. P6271]|uniref:DUF5998 family protein n=1 Tax=unclassified Rothia (in: high G+C Gram-positive bacteria) TaxID=2689056 RepID=UPI003ACEAB8F